MSELLTVGNVVDFIADDGGAGRGVIAAVDGETATIIGHYYPEETEFEERVPVTNVHPLVSYGIDQDMFEKLGQLKARILSTEPPQHPGYPLEAAEGLLTNLTDVLSLLDESKKKAQDLAARAKAGEVATSEVEEALREVGVYAYRAYKLMDTVGWETKRVRFRELGRALTTHVAEDLAESERTSI